MHTFNCILPIVNIGPRLQVFEYNIIVLVWFFACLVTLTFHVLQGEHLLLGPAPLLRPQQGCFGRTLAVLEVIE